jgi:formate dehydrogenase major subunit
MHVNQFVRGKGRFVETPYIATDERTNRRFPLILTTGRTLSQYNVGAQTRRTENVAWHAEDLLEMNPYDAEERGVLDGGWATVTSRVGETALRALITDRVPPGVVYTTFHYPVGAANVVTTEHSDWATNCPEYKVTAVQVRARSTAPLSTEGFTMPALPADVDVPMPRRGEETVTRGDLVRMSNQIAANFVHHPPDQAAAEVANHIKMFWPPSMRIELQDGSDLVDLAPLVRRAIQLLGVATVP